MLAAAARLLHNHRIPQPYAKMGKAPITRLLLHVFPDKSRLEFYVYSYYKTVIIIENELKWGPSKLGETIRIIPVYQD